MRTAVLYTKPDCVMCTATKKWLGMHKVDFETIDITEDQEAYDRISLYGYQQAPVVEILDEGQVITHFSGHRPSKLEEFFPK